MDTFIRGYAFNVLSRFILIGISGSRGSCCGGAGEPDQDLELDALLDVGLSWRSMSILHNENKRDFFVDFYAIHFTSNRQKLLEIPALIKR